MFASHCSWKRRYFCIRGLALEYYKEGADSEPLGELRLSDFKAPQLVQERGEEESVIRFEPKTTGTRGTESESTVDLKATNSKETKEWFEEIQYRLTLIHHLVSLVLVGGC